MKPKNTKYKKYHKIPLKYNYNYKTHLVYSSYGLIIKEPGIITASQIQSIVLSIKRILKRKAKIILRVFPHQSITKKPLEVRMGKGKGNVDKWQLSLKPNSVILEIKSDSPSLAKSALKVAANKLPFKTNLII